MDEEPPKPGRKSMGPDSLLQNLSKRLVIKNVRLYNFKTYAGRHDLGPFHSKFSAVIGPNGSGKSNLIDSLIFVFGKKANWMRMKKMKHILHRSKEHGNSIEAEVTIDFVEIYTAPEGLNDEAMEILKAQYRKRRTPNGVEAEAKEFDFNGNDKNDDNDWNENFLEVPGSQFSVSRYVKESGDSGYKINNRKVPQNEAVELFKIHNIDLITNRFLILQGEVEQIASMKPKTENYDNPGFLEYLEQVIGTDVYNEPIKKIQTEVDDIRLVKDQAFIKLRDICKEARDLEKKKNAAIKFVRQQKRIHQFKNLHAQCVAQGFKNEFVELEAKSNEIKELQIQETKRMNETIEEHKQCLEQLQAECKIKEKFDSELQAVKAEIKAFQTRNDKIETELADLANVETKVRGAIDATEIKITKLIEEKQDIHKNMPVNKYDNHGLTEKRAELKTQIDRIEQGVKQEHDALNSEITSLNKELEAVTKTRDDIVQEDAVLEQQLEQTREKFNQLKGFLDDNKGKLKAKQEELNTQTHFMSRLDQTHEALVDTIKKLERKVEVLTKSIREKTEESGRIQDILQNIAKVSDNSTGKGKILFCLLEAQKNNQLSGIRGRLGNLLNAPKELDIALSTAAFGAWDKIVVNTLQEAENALEFVRQNELGRTGILPLDKLQYLTDQMKNSPYKGTEAKRLFDLIKPANDDLKVALFWALGHTLVCKTLDTAKEIAYGEVRHKVVTLDGALIEKSGTMSGGGEPKRGLVNLETKVFDAGATPFDDKALTETFNVLAEQIAKYQAEYEDKANALGEAKIEYERIEAERNRLKTLKIGLANEIEVLQANVGNQEEEVKAIKQDLKNYEKRYPQLQAKKSRIAEFNGTMVKINEAIYKNEKRLGELGGGELRNLKAKHTEINAMIEENISKLNERNARLTGLEKTLEKSKHDLETLTEELAETRSKKGNFVAEQQELTANAEKSLTLQKEIQKIQKNKAKEIGKIEAKSQSFGPVLEKIKDLLARLEKEKNEIDRHKLITLDNLKEKEEIIVAIRREYENEISQYDFFNDLDTLEQKNLRDHIKSSTVSMPQAQNENNNQIIEEKLLVDQENEDSNYENEEDERIKEEQSNEKDYEGRGSEGRILEEETSQKSANEDQYDEENSSYKKRSSGELDEEHPNEDSQDEEQTRNKVDKKKQNKSKKKLGLKERKKGPLKTRMASSKWQPYLTVDVNEDYSEEMLNKLIHKLPDLVARIKFETAARDKIAPIFSAINDFVARLNAITEQQKEIDGYHNRLDILRKQYYELRNVRLSKFMEGFNVISARLKELYQEVTDGGDADLELVDFHNPFADGIEYSVRPPKKGWRRMHKLSGGEKTICSLCFIFALHYYKPNPIYFLDEVDAALDYKNDKIISRFVKEHSKNAQFISISLRVKTLEIANRIFGIYKILDCTKTAMIEPQRILKKYPYLKREQPKSEFMLWFDEFRKKNTFNKYKFGDW